MNKFVLWFVELYYIIFGMMNKKYKLEEIGGMNGEVLLRETFFGSMDFVMMYFKVNDVRDDNGELVEKLEDEGWFEFEGVRDYVINEGLVLIEVKE